MSKKWVAFSVCAITAAVVIAAYAELNNEYDNETEEL